MSTHYYEQMPLYVGGQLASEERAALEEHVARCADCHAELSFWRELAAGIDTSNWSIAAPADLAERAIERIHTPSRLRRSLLSGFNLLRAQTYLIKGEMWPASAGVMLLGVIVALLSRQTGFITFIAPLIAAASLATIYGPQTDPAGELTLSTPTSPWKILLARLTLVSAYDLVLALSGSLGLLAIIPVDMLGTLIMTWLGPLTFLSALALLLSMWIGTSNAITLAYGLWVVQYIWPPKILDNTLTAHIWEAFLESYRQFWQSPALLMLLALTVVCLALLSTRRTARALLEHPI